MKRKLVCSIAVILLLFMAPLAEAESGEELIKNAMSFDGKSVTFRGEVIGIMIRGDFAWVNVLDNGFGIGVWCRATDARKVSHIGDYKQIGDTVEVTGTFRVACPEHGGDLDIHADNFVVVATGYKLDRTPNLVVVIVSVVLVVAAVFIVYSLRRRMREKEKMIPWPWYE